MASDAPLYSSDDLSRRATVYRLTVQHLSTTVSRHIRCFDTNIVAGCSGKIKHELVGLCSSIRLIIKKRKLDTVTSTPHNDIHWLLCVNEYRSTTRPTTALYLMSMIIPVSAVSTIRLYSRHHRSADLSDLIIPRTKTVSCGP